MYTKEDLTAQIRAMGIRPDDTVLVHTSMRAIGEVENGADGVINAFRDYLTDGMFLVPTHTFDSVHKGQRVYDVRTSVPCVGALPCAAAFRSDGVRSLHPTHSIWACGKGAAEYVKCEACAPTPATPGGAWHRLAEVGAKILLIGVGNEKNTFIHSIEEEFDIPDRMEREPYEMTAIDYDGSAYRGMFVSYECSRTSDVSKYFGNFEKPLVELGAQTMGQLGDATVRVVDARKCREILLKIFANAEEDLCVGHMEIPEEYYK